MTPKIKILLAAIVYLILLFIMASIIGCNDEFVEAPPRPVGVPSEIQPYVDSFENEYHLQVSTTFTLINVGQEGGIFGQCFRSSNWILINEEYWDYVIDKQHLIWHELGHCTLGLSHDYEDRTSIMYPYIEWDYRRYNEDKNN